MKKLPFYITALLALPFTVLAQEPRDSSSMLHPTAIVQPQDSVLRLRFPAGSVRYPSVDAFLLLKQVGKPGPCCYADKSALLFPNNPFLAYPEWELRQYSQRLAKRFVLDYDELRCGTQYLIALPFMLMDSDGVMDEYDWKRTTGSGW